MYAGAMKDKSLDSRLVLQNVSHSYGAIAVLNDLNLCCKSRRSSSAGGSSPVVAKPPY
jgi:hypothetical protein